MTLYVESNGIEVDDDEISVDVSVYGNAKIETSVEVDERETVTLSLSDVLTDVKIDRLLQHAVDRDRDAVVAWCSDNDISGGAITEETLNEWLARSDMNIVAALRLIVKHLKAE